MGLGKHFFTPEFRKPPSRVALPAFNLIFHTNAQFFKRRILQKLTVNTHVGEKSFVVSGRLPNLCGLLA